MPLLNKLDFPYAARILCVVLHSFSAMTHLVKVVTRADLWAYSGESYQQKGSRVAYPHGMVRREEMYRPTKAIDAPFFQYFIPGLSDGEINRCALEVSKGLTVFDSSKSQMFGVEFDKHPTANVH